MRFLRLAHTVIGTVRTTPSITVLIQAPRLQELARPSATVTVVNQVQASATLLIRGVKVHKLLYYCQGWHLARNGEPMFEEPIEAWANGPLVADLWRAEKWGDEVPHAQDLDEAMLDTLDIVLSRYSRLSGKDLIELTHSEPPWREVSDRVEPWDDQTIRSELLKDFFATLKDHEAFSLGPFSMTPERRKSIEDAKARAQK